jgi:hypothetical protein
MATADERCEALTILPSAEGPGTMLRCARPAGHALMHSLTLTPANGQPYRIVWPNTRSTEAEAV